MRSGNKTREQAVACSQFAWVLFGGLDQEVLITSENNDILHVIYMVWLDFYHLLVSDFTKGGYHRDCTNQGGIQS